MVEACAAIPANTKGQFTRYLLAGGVAAAANIGSRFLFSLWLPFEAAVCAAFTIGLVTGFLLMRQFAFGARGGSIAVQAGKYLAVNALALIQTLVVSSLLARWAMPAVDLQPHAEPVAHAVGVAVPVFTSFLAHRAFTFK